MLFAAKYTISPSGLPPSHVSLDAAIVKVIVLPEILLNTLSSPVVPPKSAHNVKFTLVRAVQSSNKLNPTEVHTGNDAVVSEMQPTNAPSLNVVHAGNDIVVSDAQF